MTRHDDLDRTLASWLEADALASVPTGDLDRVVDATRRRRPRPAWLARPGSDWVGEAPDPRQGSGALARTPLGVRWSTALLVLVAIAALLGGALLVGARVVHVPQPPTGRLGHLAYGLDGDIYLADWDGRNAVRIADGIPPDNGPGCGNLGGEGAMWSPDGRHLAYRYTCDDTVRISDAAGRSVATFPGTGWLVSWSPDSSRVATWVELGQTIGIYGVDGVRQALLTVPAGCPLPGDFDPVWSADGMSLVIASCRVPLDGRTPTHIPAADPASHFRSASSSDGARSAFIDYPASASLVIAKTDGTQLRVLAGAASGSNGYGPGPAYESPVLSPTGDRVAFIWSPAFYDQTSDRSPNVAELRVVDVASGTVTTLASVTGNPALQPIRFSPEGDRVLFSSGHDNGVTSLWSIGIDGSDARLLVQGTDWGDWQALPPGS